MWAGHAFAFVRLLIIGPIYQCAAALISKQPTPPPSLPLRPVLFQRAFLPTLPTYRRVAAGPFFAWINRTTKGVERANGRVAVISSSRRFLIKGYHAPRMSFQVIDFYLIAVAVCPRLRGTKGDVEMVLSLWFFLERLFVRRDLFLQFVGETCWRNFELWLWILIKFLIWFIVINFSIFRLVGAETGVWNLKVCFQRFNIRETSNILFSNVRKNCTIGQIVNWTNFKCDQVWVFDLN